ncbi:MAG: hypothetical protein B7Y05_03675 [Polynucleobacter sp. 24-46-87]|jgi:hypothetical protein|nr:MAG: hypothetical protein B7Y05_03675 [Polynucleobacter sp. 24-46-87]
MKIISVSITLFLAIGLIGCGDQNSSSSNAQPTPPAKTSLKPQSQLDFEKELKSAQAKVNSSGQPGTRAYEEAKNELDNFWSSKKANMTRVDGWVCMYTNSYKWEPERNIGNPMKTSAPGPVEYDQYELLGAYCTDADKPYKSIDAFRGGETGVRILVSKAKNIEPLYAGDVIAVSGPLNKTFGVQPQLNSYRIDIDADSMKVIKKGN